MSRTLVLNGSSIAVALTRIRGPTGAAVCPVDTGLLITTATIMIGHTSPIGGGGLLIG